MNTIRFSDQENKITVDDGSNGKNVNKGKPLANKKRVRVPLGGKDSNKLFPTLNRSKSTIDNKVIPRPISRSSSTLGFTHKQPSQLLQRQHLVLQQSTPKISLSIPSQPKKSTLEYNENTIFNPQQANRPSELYQDDTDSLRKQIIPGKPPSDDLILNDNTNLPAKVSRQIHNVDPIKRSKVSNKLDSYIQSRNELFQQLVDDENSVEVGPPSFNHRESPDFFEIPESNHEVSIDLGDFQINDTLDMNEVSRDSDEELGLNESDLRDLLD